MITEDKDLSRIKIINNHVCKTEGCNTSIFLGIGYEYCVECVDYMAGQLEIYRSLMGHLIKTGETHRVKGAKKVGE